MSEAEKVTIDDLLKFCREQLTEKKGEKYKKFIDAEEDIRRNYKVVQLHDSILGYSNIDLIHQALDEHIGLNSTAIRSMFMMDDIRTLGDNFFFRFKELAHRGKRDGNDTNISERKAL